MDIFKKLLPNKINKAAIEVKDITNSKVLILQSLSKEDAADISSIFANNPYNDIIIGQGDFYNSSVTALSENISFRILAIKEIIQKWETSTWLNIHGGYDTGKSHLSLLIKDYLKYSSLSFSFKDLSQAEFKNAFVQVFQQIIGNNIKNQLIIFDDLPPIGFDDNINKLFLQLCEFCKNNCIKILSTSNHKISYKITSVLKKEFIELPIPLLSEDEITEIIQTYTSVEDHKKYCTVIKTISAGYPIYVQIICRYLESKNWQLPDNEFSNFISGKAFNKLDDETYHKLIHTTENEFSREILYRLNLILGSISNETIEIVTNVDPVINSPYEKINSITGTWLQKNDDDSYFISPLIKRLGSSNVLGGTRKEINKKLAEHILAKKSLTQHDAQRAISYFFAAELFDNAGMVMIMALQASLKQPEIFTETLFGVFWMSTPMPKEMDTVTKISIRILQIHIFDDQEIKINPKFKVEDKYFVRRDLEKILEENPDVPSEIFNISNLVLFKSLLHDDAEKALYYLDILYNIGFDKFREAEKGLYDNLWLILDKICTLDQIERWINCYRKLGKPENFYDGENVHLFSRKLFDNILLINKEDWSKSIKALKSIQKIALNDNLQLLSAYSARAVLFVQSEKIGRLADAEVYFNEISADYTNPQAIFLIKDELGRQQFYNEKKEASLKILLEIENTEINIITKLDTYLTIAKIYGEYNDALAHEYTLKAVDFAQNKIQISKLSLAKIAGEHAISLFLLGDYKSAVYMLGESHEKLEDAFKDIDINANIDDYNIAVMQIGNVLNYTYQIVNFGKPLAETGKGMATIPTRGLFNNNYNADILHEWYYEERKYMNVYLFVQFFISYNDIENSTKWANYAFEINERTILYTFKNTLRSFVCFKILENKYSESISIEKQLKDYEENLSIEAAEEIKIIPQKEMYLRLVEKKTYPQDTDEYLITFNFIPILLREITLLFEKKIDKDQVLRNLKENFAQNKDLYNDCKTYESISHILDNFPRDYNDCRNLIAIANNNETKNKKPIQIIYYIICSLKASDKDALKLHFSLMPYLEKVTMGISLASYLFILYPFVYEFWTQRISSTPQNFYFNELWQKNLAAIKDVRNEDRIVAFFCLITKHMGYKADHNEQNWMQPYLNSYHSKK